MTHFDVHRGGLPPNTPCPSDLDLARFVEGTLAADARGVMVAHLAECDDCREVVATVVAAQDVEPGAARDVAPVVAPAVSPDPSGAPRRFARTSWRSAPGAWAGVLAVAAVAIIAVRVMSPGAGTPVAVADGEVWGDVATAVGPSRVLEPRLSRLPAHVPLQPPSRSGGADTGFAAQALAARLAEKAASPAADPAVRRAAQHAAAVAALVAGRADEAVTRLEATLASTPDAAADRADLLADLAAAHAAVAATTSRERWAAALDAADQALALEAGHGAARFNRALALERLERSADAAAAWRELAADTAVAAGWRDEAARHLRALVP